MHFTLLRAPFDPRPSTWRHIADGIDTSEFAPRVTNWYQVIEQPKPLSTVAGQDENERKYETYESLPPLPPSIPIYLILDQTSA